MRTITFKNIRIKNFMSFGNEEFSLDFKTGLNLITGYNKDVPDLKNGIGKSTICDSVVFAIFDETIKNLKKAEIVNDVNKKNCEVELQFDIDKNGTTIEYIIKRGISPSYCIFRINGVDNTKSGIPQTNKFIEECLGVSKALFQQSIIMSVGNSRSFFDLKAAEKRAFIEGVFDLDIFSKMLGDVRTGATDTKKESDQLAMRLKSEQDNLGVLVDKESNFEKNKTEFITELERNNTELNSKIEDLRKDILTVPSSDEIDKTLIDLKEKQKKIDDSLSLATEKVKELEYDIKSLIKEVITLSSIGDICSKCGKPLDVVEVSNREIEIKTKNELIDTKKQLTIELRVKIDPVTTTRNKIQAEIQVQNTNKVRISGIIDNNRVISGHIASILLNIEKNKQRIIEKQAEISAFADLITKSKKNIELLSTSLGVKRIDNSAYETCKFILSEEGVKSTIIKELKSYLNTKLNSYLMLMNAPIRCEFDEYFEESMLNQFNVPKSYHSLSGGEKRRLDIAILFTLQDMLKCRSGIDVKLAFYDEILDTSVDESGRKQILEILKEKSKESAIYIISHRSKMSELIDDEIVLEKHNGYTYRRKEYE